MKNGIFIQMEHLAAGGASHIIDHFFLVIFIIVIVEVVILVGIIFVIEILANIVMLVGFPIGTLMGICGIIIYVFMTLLLLDGEVKKAMGM